MKFSNISLKERKKDYAVFEVEIDMMIEEDLQILLNNSINYSYVKVNFDIDTADKVELFYIDILKGNETINVSNKRLGRIMAAYIGELVVNHAGGEWGLCVDEEELSFGLPVIKKWGESEGNMSVCPVSIREKIKRNLNKGVFRQTVLFCSDKKKYLEDLFNKNKE